MNRTLVIPMPNLTSLCQIVRFGSVGTFAAIVHIGIVILLVTQWYMSPLLANIVAFLCSFNISYFGHHYLTFAGNNSHHSASLPRFFILATFSFILNEGLFYLLLKILPYPIALIIVLILVSGFTFCFSKIWAFRK